jgi:hypothetical protein
MSPARLLPGALVWLIILAPRAALAQDPGSDDEVLLILEEDEADTGAADLPPRFEPTAILKASTVQELREDMAHDPGEHVFELHGRFDISAAVELSPTLRADVSGRLRYFYAEQATEDGPDLPFTGEGSRWHSEPELRDLCLTWTPGAISIRAGQQVLPWGQTDFARPLDMLNPYDYREGLSSSTEVPAVPIPMLRVDARLHDSISLQGVYIPFFEPHRLYVFGSDQSPAQMLSASPIGGLVPMVTGTLDPSLWDEAQPLLSATELPSNPATDAQAGLALSFRLGGVDASVHYAYLYDRYPSFSIDADLALLLQRTLESGFNAAALATQLQDPELKRAYDSVQARGAGLDGLYRATHSRMHLAGLSAATTMWDLGLKADVAFFDGRTLYLETLELFEAPVVMAAAGIDYVHETELDLVFEVSGVAVLDEPDAPLLVLEERYAQLFSQIRWRLLYDESLQVSLGGLLSLNHLDGVGMVELRYRFSAQHALAAGAQLYEGPERSVGGLMDRNDLWFVRYEGFL